MTDKEIPAVTNPSAELLNDREVVMYREWRRNFLDWLLHEGKNPDRMEGYAESTVQKTAYRTAKLLRWVWEQEDGYTLGISHEHAKSS